MTVEQNENLELCRSTDGPHVGSWISTQGAPAAVSVSRGPGEVEKIDKAPTLVATWRTLSLAQDQIGLLTLSLLRSLAWRLGCGCRINRRADVSSLSSSGKWSGTDCGSLAPTLAVYCRCWHVDRWAARRPCAPWQEWMDGLISFLLRAIGQLTTWCTLTWATHYTRVPKVALTRVSF